MKTILANAFSLQMIDLQEPIDIKAEPLTTEQVKNRLAFGFGSCVGHQDTANILSNLLGMNVPMNRENIKLSKDIELIVAQVIRGRLPEGSTTFPEGITLQFVRVTIK